MTAAALGGRGGVVQNVLADGTHSPAARAGSQSLTSPLADDEAADLQRHELVIERGLTTFVDVGMALLAIRDDRLYRMTHGTFEEYCRERWGLRRQRAYALMDAASVVRNLSEISDIIKPARESHAAPLAALPPAEQAEVWKEAVETAPRDDNGKPKIIATHVHAVVEKHRDVAHNVVVHVDPTPEHNGLPQRVGRVRREMESIAKQLKVEVEGAFSSISEVDLARMAKDFTTIRSRSTTGYRATENGARIKRTTTSTA